MQHIGYYYADHGLFSLYNTKMYSSNWVTNICYYDSYYGKFYSPNMKNLLLNGRDLEMQRLDNQSISAQVSNSHSSFVMR